MQSWGLGDTIILIQFLLFVVLPVVLAVWVLIYRRRCNRLLQAAQSLEIGEGVTLLQGIQAYFGEDGLWLPEPNYVTVFVFPLPGCPRDAMLCVQRKPRLLGLCKVGNPHPPLVMDGLDGVVDAMVRAAKKQDR